MNHRLVSSGVVLGAALAALPAAAAAPNKGQCIAANDAAQELRQAGKLRQAREQLVVCVSQSCPGPVREDCAQRLDEVDKATPAVVFDVKDATGNDVSAVSVTMDGQPLVQKLNGGAIPVDPGEHRFTFEAVGSPSIVKVVLIREGDKDRRVSVLLGAASVPASEGPPPTSAGPSDGSAQRTTGLVLGGAGVVALVVGGVFGVLAKSTSDGRSGPTVPQAAYDQATVSTLSFIAGGVLAAGGAVLYFTAPTAGSIGVAPTMGKNEAGISLRGAW